ncbi:hypothetical protein [Ferrimonas sp. SCSIO 43195]|uniref:hypothetical protein n=1 Tax=Ferrimonas sp. SCSIO 43195 TaxID=2822844 RepID=UPI0020751668|nr:hypothetical protein [Ferrimonas sp. SCSIO 43195]USD36181.1 hypothetical protein J8Z22_14190 [Ferrimonas sp. SCSIO 43195]
MEEVKPFILLAIVLAVAAAVFPLFRDMYLAVEYGVTEIPYTVRKQWESLSILVVSLQNLACCAWLWWVTSKNNDGKLLWSAFGLLFGLVPIAIYYLVRLNDRIDL